MIDRQCLAALRQRLREAPAVVPLGPRQVGKTTLARSVAARHPGAMLLDMARESDRAVLARPEFFLAGQRDRLVVIDEVQLVPQLFSALRPEIDAARRPGRFLLLGSASGALLRQSAETLAGRVSYVELTPLLAAELRPDLPGLQQLWLRGGYPLSWLAADEAASFRWRTDFIQTFLLRDLVQMGVRIAGRDSASLLDDGGAYAGPTVQRVPVRSIAGRRVAYDGRELSRYAGGRDRGAPLVAVPAERRQAAREVAQGLRARQRAAPRAARSGERARSAGPSRRRRVILS